MIVSITEEEWYPVYELNKEHIPHLTCAKMFVEKEFYERYMNNIREFREIQECLKEALKEI